MITQSENEKIELKQRLARVLRVPSNKTCADCPETRPTWISFIKPQQKFALGSKVLASFVCLECAGLHRKLGTHICVVRSISHDQFEEKDVECAEYSGNEVVNEIFEGHLQKSTMDGINIKPVLGAEVARRERFIRQKYVDLYFYRKRAHYQHIAEVNKLIASVRKPFKSAADKNSPTKPFRKKLKKFLNDDPLSSSDRDTLTLACSTTVGNTTATNTSRTRTLTDRDDSNRSDTPLRRTIKRVATRRRSSKNNRTPNSKKNSSQEKVTDPMFGIPFGDGGEARIGESSTPQKQANVRSDLQFQEPMVPTTTTKSNIKDRGRSDLSGMILVFDEDSLETTDSPQRNNKISNELDAYRRSEPPAKQTIDVLKLQNNLLGGFTKKPLMKTTSDERDRREVTTSPRSVGRSRSEITMDQIRRKHDGSLQIHLEGEKERQKNNSAAQKPEVEKTPLIAHLTKDPSGVQNTSTRKLNIPYLNAMPVSPTSVEGIISEETSFGFGDHTINGMSGTGEANAASVVEESICTVNGFRVIDSEIAPPDSKGSFTEQFQNTKEAKCLFKSKSQRSLVHKVDEVNVAKERSTRSIGEEPTARIYLERQNSQRSIDFDPPQSKKKRSSRSLTNKSKSKSSRSLTNKSKSKSRSKSLTNKSKSSMSIDEPTTRKKLRRLKNEKDRDPSSTKKTKKKEKSRSRSLTNSPSTRKKKVKSIRSLTNSPSKKKKKKIGKESLRSLTDSPSKKKKDKSRSRSLTNSPSTRKKVKSIRSLTNSPSKKEKKKIKKQSLRSLTDLPPKKKKKEKSSRSLSNKSSTSIGKEDRALRKKLRRPRSKSKTDYAASPASTKDRTSKRRSASRKKIRTSRSKSRGRNADIMDRNRALLEEWERLKDENKREFEKLRRENQRKFADFDRHFSQHISILC